MSFWRTEGDGVNVPVFYFFSPRVVFWCNDENVFDSLVNNMINQDLAMRAVLEEAGLAGLLVFTSYTLPMPCRISTRKLFRELIGLQVSNEALSVGDLSGESSLTFNKYYKKFQCSNHHRQSSISSRARDGKSGSNSSPKEGWISDNFSFSVRHYCCLDQKYRENLNAEC
ncbi:hypothetical protein TIFTF001_045428 [Ficus carica]|uniref:AIPP2-like SPOC-like domain-containing protein n=1 Tax=Ficus carica TaxID=3494 RepID=A0AA87YSP2_FICCA|nr:hypothetical protein TIFTF001_045428 [Ficus carica]